MMQNCRLLKIMLPFDLFSFFKSAGWYPGRAVDLPPGLGQQLPEGHPAFRILSEFGGLTVGKVGRGQQCASSDVAFGFVDAADYQIEIWNDLLGTILVGIAEVHHAHGELYVDTAGRCFGVSLMHDAFYFEGESFGDAMRGLLLGRRSRPMLRPDQETVTLYGIDYDVNSPELYKYR